MIMRRAQEARGDQELHSAPPKAEEPSLISGTTIGPSSGTFVASFLWGWFDGTYAMHEPLIVPMKTSQQASLHMLSLCIYIYIYICITSLPDLNASGIVHVSDQINKQMALGLPLYFAVLNFETLRIES